VLVYRVHLGWLLGHQFILVTPRGRRTGKLRQTGVMVLRYDRSARQIYVVAGSTAADWYRNIQTAPAEEIHVGRERCRPVQSFLSTAEVADLLEWSRKCHPFQARLQALFFGWPWKAIAPSC
jgi:deazaflavin-dependent oxidoreductase (nitroreductase family)